MFIILGVATFLWAFVLLFTLLDSISSAKFLTEQERRFATDRVIIAGTGRTEKTSWQWDQFVECLIDPKTWFVAWPRDPDPDPQWRHPELLQPGHQVLRLHQPGSLR